MVITHWTQADAAAGDKGILLQGDYGVAELAADDGQGRELDPVRLIALGEASMKLALGCDLVLFHGIPG